MGIGLRLAKPLGMLEDGGPRASLNHEFLIRSFRLLLITRIYSEVLAPQPDTGSSRAAIPYSNMCGSFSRHILKTIFSCCFTNPV